MSARPPRLLHLTTIDYSLKVLLGHQLRRFAQEGFEVLGASAPGPWVEQMEADGIQHLAVPRLTRAWSPGADVLAERDLVALFRRVRPDIVHTHNPKSGVLGRVAARLARVPVIVNTVHGLYANPSLPPMRRRMISSAERWAARLSHHEFFQSDEDLQMALRTHMVRPQRASLLGNGVDLSRFDPDAADPDLVADLRSRWGAGDEQVVVGAVGRLVQEKGYRELFAAAAELRARFGAAAPVFVAIGSREPGKEDRISEAELSAASAVGVVIHGEEERMPEAYAAMDVFVLPSYREGMPRSAIEASAMRRPVIATRIRGCREVVADGQTGILVAPRDPGELTDAIAALVDDPARRASLGQAGRIRAQEYFDEELMVSRSLEVYRRLLAQRRRPAGP